MAKKSATQSPKAGSKPKPQGANNKSKKQLADRRKSNEPAIEDNEEEWEDEAEEATPKTNGSKVNKRKAREEELSEEDSDSEGSEDDVHGGIDLAGIDDSDSESELDSDGGAERDDDDDDEDDDEEEDIDVDELSASDEEDEEQIAAGTRVRQTINNKEGLLAALRRFALDTNPKTVPFAFHQSVVSSTNTEDSIPSIDDDLERELAFMNQSLEAARKARTLLRKEGVPFTRPTDFFAETIRSDETMQKVKAKMVEEATAKKASAEARKQRDLKKFGKQVQVQKQLERAKEKRDTLEKINQLKRKRQDGTSSAVGANEAEDLFDVAVDNELKSAGKKRSAGDHGGPPGAKRQKKDTKFGFGGKKRFIKSGDAMSSGDLSGFDAKRMKSGGRGGFGAGGGRGGRGGRGGGRGGASGGRGGGAGGDGPKKFTKAPRLGKSKRQAGKR
ncbi:eukaryotic rRNA processing protein EBP2-domain-containing protein [Chaetomidium leptoderma]|uniref:Eukaryotic rRNA processing protein EBP2-domain-containing protein n=1 Tax=Chaetomidium leptoderma TaxID=669021 RepID=A0AAN6VEX9_9PEZI|nr:eukaryotic rRNA processing protein EBP2-domain-containing protein [Chaetomidium leptoderma]